MDAKTIVESIDAELARIGLDKFTSPRNLAGTIEGLEQFLEMLRELPVGATWRDIHPDIPAHWDLNDDRTWTEPYRPYGAWDYQHPPAGSAVMVTFEDYGEGAKFNLLVERARAAGFELYGAGMQYTRISPHGPRSTNESNWGVIVLPLGASQDDLYSLVEWVKEQPEVLHAMPNRHEDAEYCEPDK